MILYGGIEKKLLPRFMVNGKRVLSCCSGGMPRYGLRVLWRLRYLKWMVKYISIIFSVLLNHALMVSWRLYCRPHLSIDSTTLDARWNGQLAATIRVDGQNWMYPPA